MVVLLNMTCFTAFFSCNYNSYPYLTESLFIYRTRSSRTYFFLIAEFDSTGPFLLDLVHVYNYCVFHKRVAAKAHVITEDKAAHLRTRKP